MKIEIVQKELIYNPGSIAAPSCHASTVAKMNNDKLACAWFAGANESNPDVRIWFSSKIGNSWDKPYPVTPDDSLADWNPVLYSDDSDKLTLIYKSGETPRSWVSKVIYSYDFGATWTSPHDLVKDEIFPRGPVKNKMIKLSSGRLIAPASDESPDKRWAVFFDLSDDSGKTWKRTEHLSIIPPLGGDALSFENLKQNEYGLIQPTVWEYPKESGTLYMYARSSLGYIYQSKSKDSGLNWEVATASSIPNNNSGIDSVMTESGILALIYNPVSENWGPRWPITLSLSKDNGTTWLSTVDLEIKKGEYSYPAIISSGNELYMTYTYNRESIKYVHARITI